jgi:hypothetical protein
MALKIVCYFIKTATKIIDAQQFEKGKNKREKLSRKNRFIF